MRAWTEVERPGDCLGSLGSQKRSAAPVGYEDMGRAALWPRRALPVVELNLGLAALFTDRLSPVLRERVSPHTLGNNRV
jgi:hypothetical protein